MSDCEGVQGFVCIGGWLYTPVRGMIFATNRRCPKCNAEDAPVATPKTLPVLLVPQLQCAACGGVMDYELQQPPSVTRSHYRASCERCRKAVLVPLRFVYCEIVEVLP